jgi:hypothetical protein
MPARDRGIWLALAGALLAGCVAEQAPANQPLPPAFRLPPVVEVARLTGQPVPLPAVTAPAGNPAAVDAPMAAPLAAPAPVAAPPTTGGAGTPTGPAPSLPPLVATVRLSVPGQVTGPVLAGARVVVSTPSGRRFDATSAEDGSVTLPGEGGLLVASLPEHAVSVVDGWDGGDLHLASVFLPATREPASLPVAGLVLAVDGAPAAGAIVVGAAPDGSRLGPLETDATGRFAGPLASLGGTAPEHLSLWAYTLADDRPAALGHLGDVDFGQGAPVLRLAPPDGRVTLGASGATTRPRLAVAIADDAGNQVTLGAWESSVPLELPTFAPAGCHMTASIEAVDGPAGTTSRWYGDLAASGSQIAALLPPPAAPSLPGGAQAGQLARWPAVPGASCYRLALKQSGDAVPAWEGLTRQAQLTLVGMPAGPFQELELSAMAGPGAALRSLQATAGPRRLRWPARPAPTLVATRVVPL